MSLYKDPVTTLLAVVGAANGNITLEPEDYDFISPAANSSGKYPTQNSQVLIRANNNFASYQGEVMVYYNRLSFEELNRLVDLTLKAPAVTNSHDLLPFLNDRFGTVIGEDDVELVDATDMGEYKTVVLTAKADSLGWIGTCTVSVSQGEIQLETYLTNTALSGLDYPTPYATLPFAQMYSYWRDFSAFTSFLATVKAGDAITQELATILSSVTGDTWALSGYSQFSLGGATILWAGTPADNGLFNESYDHGIQIRLNHDDAYGITGDLMIHFNDPYDPMDQP